LCYFLWFWGSLSFWFCCGYLRVKRV